MSILKSLGNVIQAGVQTAVLPFSVAKDAVMLGAIIAGEDSATVSRASKIREELEDAYDELDK